MMIGTRESATSLLFVLFSTSVYAVDMIGDNCDVIRGACLIGDCVEMLMRWLEAVIVIYALESDAIPHHI